MGCHLPLENSKCCFRAFFLPLVINAHFRTIMVYGQCVHSHGKWHYFFPKREVHHVSLRKMKRRRASICSEHEFSVAGGVDNCIWCLIELSLLSFLFMDCFNSLSLRDWFTFSSCHKEGTDVDGSQENRWNTLLASLELFGTLSCAMSLGRCWYLFED